MSRVPTQPDRDAVMQDLIDALRVFTVETDVFVDGFARAHGLGRSDLNAIMWISTGASAGEPMTIGELGRRLGLSPAATTALVDRLETVGHVIRERDPDNRRRVIVRMQDQALRLAVAFFVPLGTSMRRAAGDFTDAELAGAAAVVRRLTGAVNDARTAPGEPRSG
jgi:DNA-binding MarR family transcriptional regulator